jgi:hypothetical protein
MKLRKLGDTWGSEVDDIEWKHALTASFRMKFRCAGIIILLKKSLSKNPIKKVYNSIVRRPNPLFGQTRRIFYELMKCLIFFEYHNFHSTKKEKIKVGGKE